MKIIKTNKSMKRIRFIRERLEGSGNHIALSVYYLYAALKNFALSLQDLFRVLHSLIKREPLISMGVTAAICLLISFIEIGKARAERDKFSKKMWQQERIIEELNILTNASKH
jgi:hypothetical protein